VDSSLNTNEMKLVAYPNPTNSNFQLNLINGTEEKVAIKIYDMMGRLLESYNLNSTEVNNQKLGTGFPSGIYNVLVKQGVATKSLRIIKK
jgi:myo-inositol-hexaphosphate 3-phosphohydrolase